MVPRGSPLPRLWCLVGAFVLLWGGVRSGGCEVGPGQLCPERSRAPRGFRNAAYKDHNPPVLVCFVFFVFSSGQVYSYRGGRFSPRLHLYCRLRAMPPLLSAEGHAATSHGRGTVIGPLQSAWLFLPGRSAERLLPRCFWKSRSAVPDLWSEKGTGPRWAAECGRKWRGRLCFLGTERVREVKDLAQGQVNRIRD